MSKLDEARKALEDAETNVRAAFARKEQLMSDLIAAEAEVNEALRREMEARFAFRVASDASHQRQD